MRFLKTIFIITTVFISFRPVEAGNIDIVYPKPNSTLPSVDSTFIFGSTDSGSVLYINNRIIRVHADGGFLGFIDVSDGDFIFEIMSIKNNDTAQAQLPVTIGNESFQYPEDSIFIQPGTAYPPSDMQSPAEEIIELGFSGTPGGSAYYSTCNDTLWFPLYEDRPLDGNNNSVFGKQAAGRPTALSRYRGYAKVGEIADTSSTSIRYHLISPEGDTARAESPGSIIPPVDDIRIIEFTGKAQIVRTAPGAGYHLLYQPPGIRAIYNGFYGDFIRVKLSESITGYVPKDSVIILPPGTRIPSCRIRYIRIEDKQNKTVVDIPLTAKLPYRIEQELNPSKLIVYLYGGIGDTDWIKYIPNSGAVIIARWFQAEDRVYGLTLELGHEFQWGYSAGYDGNHFKLYIKKKPRYGGFLRSPVKGLRIVLDPGHCPDSGAVGPTRLSEMEINLWIAHKLRKILEKKGAEVIQTRYGYEPVTLYSRPEIAEDFDADLLISIHNNALPDGVNPFVNNGISTYYYHPQSKPLAEAIQIRLRGKTELPDYGVYYGNLVLTRPSEMLAVLVECAFIMIPEHEAMLKDRRFQRKIAVGIYEGICDFLKEVNK